MIELLFALAFWPWIFFGAFLIGCSVSSYFEATFGAVICAILLIAVAWLLYDSNPFLWIYENPARAGMATATYGALGILWSLFKWRKRLLRPDIQSAMKQAKDAFTKGNPDSAESYIHDYRFPHKARASENKDRIMSWVALWPFSVVGYFIGEFLVDLIARIYDILAGIYERMTKYYAP